MSKPQLRSTSSTSSMGMAQASDRKTTCTELSRAQYPPVPPPFPAGADAARSSKICRFVLLGIPNATDFQSKSRSRSRRSEAPAEPPRLEACVLSKALAPCLHAAQIPRCKMMQAGEALASSELLKSSRSSDGKYNLFGFAQIKQVQVNHSFPKLLGGHRVPSLGRWAGGAQHDCRPLLKIIMILCMLTFYLPGPKGCGVAQFRGNGP